VKYTFLFLHFKRSAREYTLLCLHFILHRWSVHAISKCRFQVCVCVCPLRASHVLYWKAGFV
jgi:hypothetical protein